MNEMHVTFPPDDLRRADVAEQGREYVSFETLAEARADPDAAVVLSAGYDATIYLTAPVQVVLCDARALMTLVSDLDAVTWMTGTSPAATVALERHPIGTKLPGGDGGGTVMAGVWTHPHAFPEPINTQAVEVILGVRERIDGDVLRDARQRELDRKRAWRSERPALPGNLPWDADIAEPVSPFPE